MAHQPSSGAPYCDPGNPENLYFSVSGNAPEKVQSIGGASVDGHDGEAGDAALAELGAGIKKRTRSSGMPNEGKSAPVTFEKDELVGLANRKG